MTKHTLQVWIRGRRGPDIEQTGGDDDIHIGWWHGSHARHLLCGRSHLESGWIVWELDLYLVMKLLNQDPPYCFSLPSFNFVAMKSLTYVIRLPLAIEAVSIVQYIEDD